MPVDLVAKTIIDLSGLRDDSSSCPGLQDPQIVYHVQNPQLFHWTTDLLPALRAAGLKFDTVSQREWVRRLRNSNQDPVQNPTVKLVDFFAEKYDNDRPGRKGLVFETHKTEAASETLRGGIDVIGSGLMDNIVRQWMTCW